LASTIGVDKIFAALFFVASFFFGRDTETKITKDKATRKFFQGIKRGVYTMYDSDRTTHIVQTKKQPNIIFFFPSREGLSISRRPLETLQRHGPSQDRHGVEWIHGEGGIAVLYDLVVPRWQHIGITPRTIRV
jgi:hypothetical protein